MLLLSKHSCHFGNFKQSSIHLLAIVFVTLIGSVNVASGQVGGITFTNFKHDLKRNGNVLGGGDSPTYRFKDLIESAPSVKVTNN